MILYTSFTLIYAILILSLVYYYNKQRIDWVKMEAEKANVSVPPTTWSQRRSYLFSALSSLSIFDFLAHCFAPLMIFSFTEYSSIMIVTIIVNLTLTYYSVRIADMAFKQWCWANFEKKVAESKLELSLENARLSSMKGLHHVVSKEDKQVVKFYIPISKSDCMMFTFEPDYNYTKAIKSYEEIKKKLVNKPDNQFIDFVKKWESSEELPQDVSFT